MFSVLLIVLVILVLLVTALYLIVAILVGGLAYINGFTSLSSMVAGLRWWAIRIRTLALEDDHWVCKQPVKPWLRRRGLNAPACSACRAEKAKV